MVYYGLLWRHWTVSTHQQTDAIIDVQIQQDVDFRRLITRMFSLGGHN